MTVSTTTARLNYSGDDSTTVFSYTFRILDDDEIKVELKDSSGTVTTQTKTTHYTVTGVGDTSGGTITMVTAPASGETLTLTRNVPLTQAVDYTENDSFPAETHEEALDKLTMIAQQLNDKITEAPQIPKAWCVLNGSGAAAVSESYNVDSIADNGTGDYTITWDLTFNSTTYAVFATCNQVSSTPVVVNIVSNTTTTTRIKCENVDGTDVDPTNITVIVFGDLA